MEKNNKKILIVEDDKNFLWLLRQGFEMANLEVIFALDGQEGLEMAEKEKPDLIVADISMPRMNGLDMAKKIREKGISSKIIFLTNFDDVGHICQAIETIEQTDYIVKSDVHVGQIVERVKVHLGIE